MELFKRENYLKKMRGFYDCVDIIKVITGVRRCGKSTLMELVANELEEKGVNAANIVYLNLDKRPYMKVDSAEKLDELIQSKVSNIKGIKYLFIDEIQNVVGFEKLINAYREECEYSIFITGSNSYLLSGELVTKLTGRYVEFEIFPLTFEEYLAMKKFYNKDVSANLQIELSNYVAVGGFPGTMFFESVGDRQKYAFEVIKEIFEKDIRHRVKIKNVASFEAVRNFIINNFDATMSINSLHEALKKGGIEISQATLSKYIQVLLDAKILYECVRFDVKSKKALSGEKKYYIADLGFSYAINPDGRINYGAVLENIVYFYARSKDYVVSIGKIGKFECDFILRDIANNYAYVQVAYTIAQSRDTEDREFRPLESIRDNYPKYVATTDYILQKRNGIKHINIMEFMKEGQRF